MIRRRDHDGIDVFAGENIAEILRRGAVFAFVALIDGLFGAYANASLGPLPEVFARPGGDERTGMAAAALGVRVIGGVPEGTPSEGMNPKHTLPENLAWVRRRMALFAQTHADYPSVTGFDYGWRPSGCVQ